MSKSPTQSPALFLLALVLLSVYFLVPASAAGSTLTQSSAIAGGEQPRLVSPSDVFRLGLFPLANNTKWFLGIWFTVSPAAVVWVANRERPLNTPSSAVLALTARGSLVLLDASRNNETIWSSNSSSAGAAVKAEAQLQDNGNLVVVAATDEEQQRQAVILWQSFEHPTNTFLSGMRSGKDLRTGALWSLSSWRGADDPSPGAFRYVMDTAGSPELHVWKTTDSDDGHGRSKKTYRTGPWNGVRFSGIPEMTTFEDMFEFRFTNAPGSEVSYTFRDRVVGGSQMMSRVVLNESGVMQRMVWDGPSAAWSSFWTGPRDRCDTYGLCGAFGVCNVVDAVVCSCVKGFAPRSPAEWRMRNASGGCARVTPLQRKCAGAGEEEEVEEDGFYVLRGVKLPETHGGVVDAGATLEECGRRCLANCSCTAYAAADIRGGGTGCVQWFGDLVDTRFVEPGQDLFVRLAKSDLEATTKTNKLVGVIAAVATGFALLLLSLGCLIWRRRKAWRSSKQAPMFGEAFHECPTYQLEIIRAATDGFCPGNEIGRGGFGIVYKGRLSDGQEVAVKKLSAENRMQGFKEFMNEVEMIAKLQHRNLVRLLGCCIHGSERILVYEYMSNKSLDAFIFDARRRASLSWRTRMEIILGVARGLVYLHQDSRHTMIHRDLKAANVLLDGDMVAKISDFGIARIFSSSSSNAGLGDLDCSSTVTERIVGTYGYMSPEYAMGGMVSFMQDVYSFGVLLLEIVGGRRNQRSFNLIAHAWKLFEEDRSLELLDPTVRGGCGPAEMEQAATCIQVGLLCVQESPSQRPPMAAVIQMLSHQQAPGRPRRPVVCTPMSNPAAALIGVQEEVVTSGSGELTITNLEGR